MKALFHNDGQFGILFLLLSAILVFSCMIITHGMFIPMGFFVPCIMLGAVIGRLYSEVLKAYDPELIFNDGVFAVLGGAAMITGITRLTITSVVLFFEVTNQSYLNLPLMIVVIVTF